MIGILLFLAMRTRPDICAAVGILCRYTANPNTSHFITVKRILRYLAGTADFGLRLERKTTPKIIALADADWAGDPRDRKFTSGFLLRFGNSSLSWKTVKQFGVAMSPQKLNTLLQAKLANK